MWKLGVISQERLKTEVKLQLSAYRKAGFVSYRKAEFKFSWHHCKLHVAK